MTGSANRTCAVADCDQPPRDTAVVCDQCVDRLARALGDVAALDGRRLTVELATTMARRDAILRDGVLQPPDVADAVWPVTVKPQRLAFDWDAADLGWALRNTLTTWARLLAGEQDDPAEGPTHDDCLDVSCSVLRAQRDVPADNPASIAAWMLRRLDVVAHHPAAAELLDEVIAVVRAVERTVDRPVERWYAGPCTGTTDDGADCAAELYAVPNAETLTCRDCGAVYDLEERRQWLLDEAEDALAHAELIAKAATSLGEPITPAMIRGYAHRNRIWAKSVDLLGRPLYRVGDVLEVLRDTLRRKAERHSRKAERRVA